VEQVVVVTGVGQALAQRLAQMVQLTQVVVVVALDTAADQELLLLRMLISMAPPQLQEHLFTQ
jgi:hypothetical protein